MGGALITDDVSNTETHSDNLRNHGTATFIGLSGVMVANDRNPVTAAPQTLFSDGNVRLIFLNSTTLSLIPFNGGSLIINGIPEIIPSAGCQITNAGLTASTVYYVYAAFVSIAFIELSTTPYTRDNNGNAVKSGDFSRRLVGMIATNASNQFQSDTTFQGVLTYFNRRTIGIFGSYSNSTSSATFIPLMTPLYFLNWSEEYLYACAAGYSQNTNATNATMNVAIYLNGTTQLVTSLASISGNTASSHALIRSYGFVEGTLNNIAFEANVSASNGMFVGNISLITRG